MARPTTDVTLAREPSSILLRLVALASSLVALEARPLGSGLTWLVLRLLGFGTWYLLTTPLLSSTAEHRSGTSGLLVASGTRKVCVVVPFRPFCRFV